MAQGATQAVDEVGWRLDRFMQANPLAVGAIAVGAGALAGTLIPETPQEQQLARRRVAPGRRHRPPDRGRRRDQGRGDPRRDRAEGHRHEQLTLRSASRARSAPCGPGSVYRSTSRMLPPVFVARAHRALTSAAGRAGHTGCNRRRVGTESDLRLAIRTIAVSARAAIDSSNKLGRPDVAAECAQRGLKLLDGLRDQLGADVPDEISQAVRDSRAGSRVRGTRLLRRGRAPARDATGNELATCRIGEELVDRRNEVVDRERLFEGRHAPRLGEA